jgi:hypothetical protein
LPHFGQAIRANGSASVVSTVVPQPGHVWAVGSLAIEQQL